MAVISAMRTAYKATVDASRGQSKLPALGRADAFGHSVGGVIASLRNAGVNAGRAVVGVFGGGAQAASIGGGAAVGVLVLAYVIWGML